MGGEVVVLQSRIRVKQAYEAAQIGAAELSTLSRRSTQATALMQALVDAVTQNVIDPAALAAIQMTFTRLTGD